MHVICASWARGTEKALFELLLRDYHGQQGGFAGIFVLKLNGKAIGGAFNLAYGAFMKMVGLPLSTPINPNMPAM